MEYDHIVIGGGLFGCYLALKLVEIAPGRGSYSSSARGTCSNGRRTTTRRGSTTATTTRGAC